MKTPSYQVEAGRGIVRDGVRIASIGREGLSPTETDELAREIAKALNDAPRLRAEIRRLRRELRAARKL